MKNDDGVFPFGQINTERPMRSATIAAAAAVVGVYPSAWHVTWRAPGHVAQEGRSGGVRALAVDVEPTVFWNGDSSAFAQKLQDWKAVTGFNDGDEPGQHGFIDKRSPTSNGSSGDKVERSYLAPLGISPDAAAFTDIYPVFVVKRGGGNRREQGDAIAQEYDAVAAQLGFERSNLPSRPTPTALRQAAVKRFGSRTLSDLERADPQLVVTLGDEVFWVMKHLTALSATAPPTSGGVEAASLLDLYDNGYGGRGTVRLNGHDVEWLPLVHPGLLKGSPDLDARLDRGHRTMAGWGSLHGRWATSPT